MLLKKNGFPDEDEIVQCTVTNVQHHSVFVKLDEFEKSGLIHISEVSPGRIRNIRDFVKEGKVIICKVLRVNKEKGHIDLSLRRVNEGQRRSKVEDIKKEKFAEKIIEGIAKQFKAKPELLYEKIFSTIEKEYDLVYPFFEGVSDGSETLEKLDVDEQIVKALEESIKEKIKPEIVHIGGRLKLLSYAPNGINRIRDSLLDAQKIQKDVDIMYEGAGNFRVRVSSSDFKDAEKILKKVVDKVTKTFEKNDDKASFERIEE